MKMKICGVRNTEMLRACVNSKVDFLGFNFVPMSRRCMTSAFCEKLRTFPKHTQYVGVFQNQLLEEVESISTKYDLDFIQLHGEESLSFIRALHLPVIKGISLQKKQDIEAVVKYFGSVQIILLDGPVPGKGKGAEKTLLEEAVKLCRESHQKYAIAGGVSSGNIESLIEQYPDATFFDSASSLEDEHGHFSEEKLLSLLTQIS